ncbi:MAG: thiol:disulfide interchange protein DsbA/DsbL [Succinivibrionaceae bacterium]|nr:thiol:disulfide interchange protein DsbA/DsbL [Succinivibrionaceae bacterium]
MYKMLRLGLAALLWVAAVAATPALAATAGGQVFEEGKDYTVAAGHSRTASPEIRVFMSFWCGHCYGMQGQLHRLREAVGSQAAFYENPVRMMGGAAGVESQSALAVARLLGVEDAFTEELFHRVHETDDLPRMHEDFNDIFNDLGVAAEEYERELGSFHVAGMVAQFDQLTDDYEIDAVPTVLVNGLYFVSLDAFDDEARVADLVKYLLSLKGDGAGSKPAGAPAKG